MSVLRWTISPGVTGTPPQELAVEAVKGRQRVQPGLFPFLEGDVAKKLEDAAGRRHRHLRQRRVAGIGEELRQVRPPGDLVLRRRVVVRSVIRVAPVVHAFRETAWSTPFSPSKALPSGRSTRRTSASGTLDPVGYHHEGVGEVVGQVQTVPAALAR